MQTEEKFVYVQYQKVTVRVVQTQEMTICLQLLEELVQPRGTKLLSAASGCFVDQLKISYKDRSLENSDPIPHDTSFAEPIVLNIVPAATQAPAAAQAPTRPSEAVGVQLLSSESVPDLISRMRQLGITDNDPIQALMMLARDGLKPQPSLPHRLLGAYDMELTFSGRGDTVEALLDTVIAQGLRQRNIVHRAPLPALMAMSGVGKSRFLAEMHRLDSVREYFEEFEIIPLHIPLGCTTALCSFEEPEHMLAARIYYDMFAGQLQWLEFLQVFQIFATCKVAWTDPCVALQTWLDAVQRKNTGKPGLMLLAVDDVTRYPMENEGMSKLLKGVSTLCYRSYTCSQQDVFVLPVLAGTNPLTAASALETVSQRKLDLLPLPFLSFAESMKCVEPVAAKHLWMRDQELQWNLLTCSGHGRSIADYFRKIGRINGLINTSKGVLL